MTFDHVDIVDVINNRATEKAVKTTRPVAPSTKKKPIVYRRSNKQFYYCFGCGAVAMP